LSPGVVVCVVTGAFRCSLAFLIHLFTLAFTSSLGCHFGECTVRLLWALASDVDEYNTTLLICIMYRSTD
jgi:hypothetical protein